MMNQEFRGLTGGSTTMVAGGRLLGRPSDATGERPVGDALLVQASLSG